MYAYHKFPHEALPIVAQLLPDGHKAKPFDPLSEFRHQISQNLPLYSCTMSNAPNIVPNLVILPE